MSNPESTPSRSDTENGHRYQSPNARLRLNGQGRPVAIRHVVALQQPGSAAVRRYQAVTPRAVRHRLAGRCSRMTGSRPPAVHSTRSVSTETPSSACFLGEARRDNRLCENWWRASKAGSAAGQVQRWSTGTTLVYARSSESCAAPKSTVQMRTGTPQEAGA